MYIVTRQLQASADACYLLVAVFLSACRIRIPPQPVKKVEFNNELGNLEPKEHSSNSILRPFFSPNLPSPAGDDDVAAGAPSEATNAANVVPQSRRTRSPVAAADRPVGAPSEVTNAANAPSGTTNEITVADRPAGAPSKVTNAENAPSGAMNEITAADCPAGAPSEETDVAVASGLTGAGAEDVSTKTPGRMCVVVPWLSSPAWYRRHGKLTGHCGGGVVVVVV